MGDIKFVAEKPMNVRRKNLLACIAVLTVILASPVVAEDSKNQPDFADGLSGGPDYWAVTGVPENDVLNVRSGVGMAHEVTGALANGDMARNLGCRMERAQRWCLIRTLGDQPTEGWVNGHYLKEAASPGVSGRQGIHHGDSGPDVAIRSSGEFEVIFPEVCVALYASNGRKITAGATCSGGRCRAPCRLTAGYRRYENAWRHACRLFGNPSVPFDGRERNLVDLAITDRDGPDITFQAGVDLPVGGIDIVFHEIDGEFLTLGTHHNNRGLFVLHAQDSGWTGSEVVFAGRTAAQQRCRIVVSRRKWCRRVIRVVLRVQGRGIPVNIDTFLRKTENLPLFPESTLPVCRVAILVAVVAGLIPDRREIIGHAIAAGDGDRTLALREGAGKHLAELVRTTRVDLTTRRGPISRRNRHP